MTQSRSSRILGYTAQGPSRKGGNYASRSTIVRKALLRMKYQARSLRSMHAGRLLTFPDQMVRSVFTETQTNARPFAEVMEISSAPRQCKRFASVAWWTLHAKNALRVTYQRNTTITRRIFS